MMACPTGADWYLALELRGDLGQSGPEVVPNLWACLFGFAEVSDLAEPYQLGWLQALPEKGIGHFT